jgi:hypothetical protein
VGPDDYRDAREVVLTRIVFLASPCFVVFGKAWGALGGSWVGWPLSAVVSLSVAAVVVLPRTRRVGCVMGTDSITVRSWLRTARIDYDRLQYVVSTRADKTGVSWESASVALVYRSEAGTERRFRLCGFFDDARAEDTAERLHAALPPTVQARVRLVYHRLEYSTLRYLNPGE